MATTKVYNECCRYLKKYPLYNLTTHGKSIRMFKPDLLWFFGKKLLVNKREFMNCSESEKRRHLGEDRFLRTFYIESHPHRQRIIEESEMITSNKDVK